MQDNEPINLTYGQMSDMVNRIEQIPPLKGEGAPTSDMPAFHLGQTYIDTTTGDMYYCSGASNESGGLPEYTWELVTEDAPEYVAGDNITITEESGAYVISADSASYTAGDGIDITNAVISATNTGKARALTTADYNYDFDSSGSYNCVALWTLEAGVYAQNGTVVALATGTKNIDGRNLYIVAGDVSGSRLILQVENSSGSVYVAKVRADGGSRGSEYMLNTSDIRNNLNSTDVLAALSAKQGKVLKDLVDSLVIRASGAPTTSTVGSVGTLYEDTTNGKLYICTAVSGSTYTWTEVGAGGGGSSITELTSADYNWPTNSPDGVALWLLDTGKYIFPTTGIKIYACSNNTAEVISSAGDYTTVNIVKGNLYSFIYYMNGGEVKQLSVRLSDGIAAYRRQLNNPDIVQATGTSTTDVMSQNAVTSMVFADPGNRDKVQIGKGNSVSGAINLGCVIAGNNNTLESMYGGVLLGDYSNVGTNSNSSYAVAIGSHTNATGNQSVALGYHPTASGTNSIAIGGSDTTLTVASAYNSIALGGARATVQGQFDVSTGTNATGGYNSSNYRLLTGLYDPQSDHDAATKGYVDPTTDSSAPTTATVGRLGQIQIDTTTATAYMCVEADDVTPSYTWKQITA